MSPTLRESSGKAQLSLSERAHLIAMSLRYTGWGVLAAFGFLLLLTLLTLSFWVDYKNELAKYGRVEHDIPFSSTSSFTPYNTSKYPTTLLTHIVIYQARIIFLIWALLSILFGATLYFVLYTVNKFRRLDQWDKDYLIQSYFLNFQARIPQGRTTGEKILYLASSVFPELRPDFRSFLPSIDDRIIWFLKTKKDESRDLSKSLNYMIDSYSLDLALKMRLGYFIVKDFKDKTVTLVDLKQLIRVINRKFGNKVFRIICTAKKYDASFYDREGLNQLMTREIVKRTNYNLDLLIEEERGYSVLWID